MSEKPSWAEVEKVYLDAVGLPEEEQTALLDEACAGAPWLREEVETLLAADRASGDFLSAPPALLAADLLDRNPGALGPGAPVGPYRIERLLSMGGMGEVYLATDAGTGRPAVVKLIRRHLSENALAVARFATEARAAASLLHTNIVEVYEAGESEAGMYIAMEWVDGPTLRKLMEPGPVAMADAVDWSRQAARGLAAAHESRIVHRDIKPENIMLNSAGEVKLLDFGLARLSGGESVDAPASGGSGTISGTLSGTFSYLAPELLMGETASAATDIFAMGSVFYELFTGRHPFAGATPLDVYEAIECRTPEAPSTMRAGVPEEVDRVLLRMLDRDPEKRPGAAEIAAALEALVS